MDKCPPELHSYICQLACSHHGRTVRSLSLVSKYFFQISSPYLYQCLTLSTLDQIHALSTKLASIPPHMRHIRHLFLSDKSNSHEPDLHKRTPTHTPDANTISHILTLAAPTLETLAFVTTSPQTSTALIARLFRIPFPRLVELTLVGYYPFPNASGTMPRLQRLHLSGNRNPHGLLQIGALADACPSLTHLRVSGLNMALSFSLELEEALKSDDRHALSLSDDNHACDGHHILSTPTAFPAKLPPHTQCVLIQFGPAQPLMVRKSANMKQREMVKRLDALSGSRLDDAKGEPDGLKFVLLDRSTADISGEVVRRHWMDRLEGEEGCWAC